MAKTEEYTDSKRISSNKTRIKTSNKLMILLFKTHVKE